jgi:hypothetical protein
MVTNAAERSRGDVKHRLEEAEESAARLSRAIANDGVRSAPAAVVAAQGLHELRVAGYGAVLRQPLAT